jgi:hypothetical protein
MCGRLHLRFYFLLSLSDHVLVLEMEYFFVIVRAAGARGTESVLPGLRLSVI